MKVNVAKKCGPDPELIAKNNVKDCVPYAVKVNQLQELINAGLRKQAVQAIIGELPSIIDGEGAGCPEVWGRVRRMILIECDFIDN